MKRAIRRRLLTLVRNVILLLLRTVGSAGRRPAPRAGERLRIVILLQNAYAMGGTVRTVLNLAGHLADEHDVEIVSVVRMREKPFFAFPTGVPVTPLDDRTRAPGRLGRVLARMPSVLVPEDDASFSSSTLRSDLLLLRRLRRVRSCLVIGTRPSLNLFVARGTAREVVTIGQDHMNLPSYRPYLRKLICRAYRRLDALVVLTEASLADYRAALPRGGPRITRIPNALADVGGGPADLDAKVIVTAGRLGRQKGYDLLIEAYAEVAPKHPDWQVRVFGGGRERDALQAMIEERGLGDQIRLMGRSRTLGAALAKGSIYVLSSRFEGLPMVLIEAMSKGLPAVAFDCPTGPAEMIRHGQDGLLVEPENTTEFAKALLELIEDDDRRHRLGRAAMESAQAYSLDIVGAQWDSLLAELVASRTG